MYSYYVYSRIFLILPKPRCGIFVAWLTWSMNTPQYTLPPCSFYRCTFKADGLRHYRNGSIVKLFAQTHAPIRPDLLPFNVLPIKRLYFLYNTNNINIKRPPKTNSMISLGNNLTKVIQYVSSCCGYWIKKKRFEGKKRII